MALVARGVDSGVGIDVLVDGGATGDMQIMKLAIATLGSQVLIPADATNGLLVQVSNASVSTAITSVVPGTGATNLGKAEDAVAASGDVGVMALAVQRSTAVADGADGDYTPLHTDALGKLWTAGVQVEDAAATSGDRGTFILAVRRDTATSGAAAGDYHEIEVDATGGLWIAGSQIEDVAATSGDRGVFALAVRRDVPTSSAAAGDYHELQVDALGRQWVTGTQIEDAVAGSGDTGHFVLAVRRDTPTSGAAAGDYHELEVDSLGRLWTTGTQIEDAVAGSGDSGNFMLAVRRDSATSGAAAGDYHELQVDALGRLRTIDKWSEATPSNSTTTALDNDGPVVKGSAGTLYGFQGTVDAAGFVQVHDKATAPVSTNIPVIVIKVASGDNFSLNLATMGRAFSNGIAFGFSSTLATYTDGGSHLWVDAQYI